MDFLAHEFSQRFTPFFRPQWVEMNVLFKIERFYFIFFKGFISIKIGNIKHLGMFFKQRGKMPASFITELIQAMPGASALRQKIAKETPGDKLEKLATLARFRTKMPTAAVVKPTVEVVLLVMAYVEAGPTAV